VATSTVYSKTVEGTTYSITTIEDWASTDAVSHSDFNRIETNTQTLRNMLTAMSYVIDTMTFTTGRTMSSIEFLSSITRIENNIETIRGAFLTPPDYEGAETWSVGKGFDYIDMNRLETNIRSLFNYAANVYDSFFRCGQINAGNARGDLPNA